MIEHLVDLFQHNYEDLENEHMKLPLELSIQHFLFTTPLAALLSHSLRKLHDENDQRLFKKIISFGWEDVFKRLGIKERFKLGKKHCDAFPVRCTEPYQMAVDELRRMSSETTPLNKMTCLCTFAKLRNPSNV